MVVGLAVGVQLDALFRPVDGLQLQDVPPEPERPVDAPAQIDAVPEADAVGRGLTVTVVGADAALLQPALVTMTV